VAALISATQTSSFGVPSIRTIDPLRPGGWDVLFTAQMRCSVFHSEGWARVLHQSYGHAPYYLAAMDNEGAGALLPIMEVDSPLTGRRGVAVPFSDECAAVCAANHDAAYLFERALELGRERKWKYLEVRGAIPGIASTAIPWANYVGHVLDLSVGLKALFSGLDASVRRAIRKAERNGVRTARSTSAEAMESYYSLHCITRRKHGVPPQPFAFFQRIVEHLFDTNHGFIMEARHEGHLVAASVFLHRGRTAIYKFGASDPSRLSLRANDLLMWAAIQWLTEQGYTEFSMGRSAASNEGLRRFKRGFGTTEQPICYFRHDLRQEKFVAGMEETESWVNRMLRLTPLTFLKMFGRAVYPHLH